MPDVVLYSTANCGYCVAAKNLLKSRGATYREVRIDIDASQRAEMVQKTRRTSVPQIFIDATHIGGFEELVALDRAGGLKPLLDTTP